VGKRKYKYEDDYIERLVEGANACKTRKERKAFCKTNNIRLDNLRRMAKNRGWKLNEFDDAVTARAKKGARARWGKKKTHSQRVKAGLKRASRKLQKTNPGDLLNAFLDDRRVKALEIILEITDSLDRLRKAVE
jgi:hypothetical protein